MLWWWLAGIAAWLAAIAGTCALLAAAKRADAALEPRDAAAASAKIAAAAVPYVGWLLDHAGEAVVVAARERRPVGRVVAVAVGGAAVELIGCPLSFDDSVVARAAMTGRAEMRPDAVAAPLRQMGETVGAIGFSVPRGARVPDERTKRLLHAAAAINRQLDAVAAVESRRVARR